MALEDRSHWYFTNEQLQNTPSRKCGIDAFQELLYRQRSAGLISEMGRRLRVSLLCINNAIVYMHRFYVFHSFTHFPGSAIAAAALFISVKVEDQHRKLEHLIEAMLHCKRQAPIKDLNSERYAALSQELVTNEGILFQTLGFEITIEHPHAHVVNCCHLIKASKELVQVSYIIASNSLHLTTMCLRYSPTVVACFCIYLASKWTNWEIPLSNEKEVWFSYVDETVTAELLQQLTNEFLNIYEKCPNRLRAQITSIRNKNHGFHTLLDGINSARALDASSGEQNRDERDKKDFDRTAHHAIKSVHPDMPSTSKSSGNTSNYSIFKRGSSSHHQNHGHVPSSDAKLIRNVQQSSSSHTFSNVSRVDGRKIQCETAPNSHAEISKHSLHSTSHSVNDENHDLHGLLNIVDAAEALKPSSGEQNRDQKDKKDVDRTAHHAIKSVHPDMHSTSESSWSASNNSRVKHGSISHHQNHGHVPSSDAKLIRNVHQSSSSHTSSNVSSVDIRDILRENSNKNLPIPNRKNVGSVSSNTTNNSNHHVTRLPNSDKYNEYCIYQKHDVKFKASVNESVSSRAALTDVNGRPNPSMESKLQQRHLDDHKPHSSNKNILQNDIKKHLNTSLPEKSLSVSRTQSTNSSYSQRSKSPHDKFRKPTIQNTSQSHKSTKFEQSSNHIKQPNGNLNLTLNQTKSIKKRSNQQPPIMKRPALFTPDPITPNKKIKIENPPVKKEIIKNNGNRTRTTSNTSEPELRDVIKKMSSIGIKTNKAETIEKKSNVPVFQFKEVKLSGVTPAILETNHIPAIQIEPKSHGILTNAEYISRMLKITPPSLFQRYTTNLPLNSVAIISTDDSLEGLQKETKSVNESHQEHKKNKNDKQKQEVTERNVDEKEKKKKHRENDKHKHKRID